MIKQAAKEALILIVTALIVGGVVYAIRPDKIVPASTPAAEERVDSSPGQNGVREVSIEEAWRLFQAQAALIADARHRADFEAGHVQGAVHLYAADAEVWLSGFLSATDPMATIITYCDGESCTLARDLAELLVLNGFEDVRYLKNGWTRWREKGYPVQ